MATAFEAFYPMAVQDASLAKTASLGALVGAIRSGNLSDEDKALLKKHYGLGSDASLALRNVGRGILGDFGGAIAGGIVGGALGGLTGKQPAIADLSNIGALAGSIYGSKKSTDKYSVGNARDIRRKLNRS